MEKATNLTEALAEFKARYPNVTSADLQTFILGFNAGKEIYSKPFVFDGVNGSVFTGHVGYSAPDVA